MRFLRDTAFPIAMYGCESWAMRSDFDAFELWCYRRRLRVSGMERKTNKWVLDKIGSVLMLRKNNYVGEEDEVLWPHRPEERYGEKTDAREDGRQAEKGQTSNDLVPGFERTDQAGHCWCITTGDRSGKKENNHQSNSSGSADRERERVREGERGREREEGEGHRERKREREM